MENIINKKYPVFEANQVLSNKHLNGLVAYLEEQDRVSRTCLLGMGIVCGLEVELSSSEDELTINSGTALSSLGFLIKFEKTTFTHFKDADISENFISPVFLGSAKTYLGLPFPPIMLNGSTFPKTQSALSKIPSFQGQFAKGFE